MNTVSSAPTASFLRRMGACLYDGLLVLALWMVGTVIVLPFTGGEAIPDQFQPLFQAYLVVLTAAFFIGFWRHAGQTLGMRAWHLRVQQPDGSRITLQQGLIRFWSRSSPGGQAA
ncbi:RDD family protein [Alkalilimnicola ehrlichii]|uniref:RDD family protein n=1 Tax=Alkalilimnicola ehrlichii TaxID=351052 RepID=UPI0021631A78|nr:RDD family protein [Alkalilimnicola ehrlichii]